MLAGCIMDDVEDIVDILNPDNPNATIGSSPDLTLTDALSSPDRPEIGQTVKISVTVRNAGRKSSPRTVVSMMMGDEEVGRASVPELSGGQSSNVDFSEELALPSGVNVIKFLVDPDNNVKETDEKNNCLGTTVVVGEPIRARFFRWFYEGRSWTLSLRMPFLDLEGLPQERAITAYGQYLNYVKPNDRTVKAVSEILKFYVETAGYLSYDEVSFVLAFVQEMPYTSDEESKGDNYPRYPVETLLEGGGDCEDTSALFASIMGSPSFNYGAALLIIDDHMAVGIRGNEGVGGTYFQKGTKRYYYCETTGKGYAIGEVPDQYVGAEIKELLELP